MKFFKQITKMISFAATILIFLWSCEDNKPDDFGREPYDPSKPVRIDNFLPDSGGMATKVFITGSNFGSDLTKIKVYFNNMRAPVVGSDGKHIYAITPRQPGRENTISVVVSGDSAVYADKKYLYRTMTTVTTITGKKGTAAFKGGTLSEAEFHNPSGLCVDAEGNIILVHWRVPYCVVLINQEKDIVQAIHPGSNSGSDAFGAPTADADGKVIMAPTDGGDGFCSLDPESQWTPKLRMILHPEQGDPERQNWTSSGLYKYALAICYLDGCVYTHFNNGQLIKFNPLTRQGQLVDILITSNNFLYFDPVHLNILYIAYSSRHVIYKYDILTRELTRIAGTDSKPGWVDGPGLESEFNYPSQLVADKDGSVYVADRYNHCIRRITPDGMVSTVVGKGGFPGYQDGNPEDALFNNPKGVAIDREGTIYVADYENNCIRKLSIE